MGVGYQKFQAGSPDGYLDFGVISTPALYILYLKLLAHKHPKTLPLPLMYL